MKKSWKDGEKMKKNQDPEIEEKLEKGKEKGKEKEKKSEKESEKKKEADDYSFMQEQIKKRPVNKRKLLKRTFTTGAMAIMFGVVASLAFILLEPVFTKLLTPKDKEQTAEISLPDTTLPEEQNEVLPGDMVQEQEDLEHKDPDPTVPVTSSITKAEFDIEDYQKMFGKLSKLAGEVSKSMVVVTGSSSDVDWFRNVYENKSSVSGLLIADNGKDLFLITNYSFLSSATEIDVIFATGEECNGTMVSYDKATNIAVISVPLSSISQETKDNTPYATLGNSNGGLREGDVVIAVGDPMGYSSSVGYGIVTSKGSPIYTPDWNYKLVTTDIYGSRNAEGFLINTKGQVIGVLNQKYNNSDLSNQISAIGISELRSLIEDLSNQKQRPYLGLTTADITQAAVENGVPVGIFVRKVEMNSPAMEVGIAAGDIITRIGYNTITTNAEFEEKLKEYAPSDEVKLTIMRQTGDSYKEVSVTVTLGTKTE